MNLKKAFDVSRYLLFVSLALMLGPCFYMFATDLSPPAAMRAFYAGYYGVTVLFPICLGVGIYGAARHGQ